MHDRIGVKAPDEVENLGRVDEIDALQAGGWIRPERAQHLVIRENSQASPADEAAGSREENPHGYRWIRSQR